MAATSTLGQIGKCCGELVLYPMAIRTGLAAYVVSAAFVALGVSLGLHVLRPSEGAHGIRRVPASGNVYIDAMTRWDGQWLLQIATEGYTFDPRGQSSVALYPFYPFLIALLSRLSLLRADVTGLLVSHAAFLGALTLLSVYASAPPTPTARASSLGPSGRKSGRRRDRLDPARCPCVHAFPTTFFMRMVYSESLFLFLSVLAFVAIRRHWPAVYVAFLAGLATATRSVGVALSAAVLWQIWKTASWKTALPAELHGTHGRLGNCRVRRFPVVGLRRTVRIRENATALAVRPLGSVGRADLVVPFLGTVWSAYLPSLPGQWDGYEKGVPLRAQLPLCQPDAFPFGLRDGLRRRWRKWLSGTEVIFAVGLLAIPYLALGLGCCMRLPGPLRLRGVPGVSGHGKAARENAVDALGRGSGHFRLVSDDLHSDVCRGLLCDLSGG